MHVDGIYIDHARQINLILILACIAGLTTNMIVRWRIVNRRTRRILSWIYAIFLNFAYGYIITIQQHRPFNPSVLIATVCLTGLFISMLWHPDGDEKRMFEDNSLGSRILIWIDHHVRALKARRGKESGMTDSTPEFVNDEEDIEEPNLDDLPKQEPDAEWQDSGEPEPTDDEEDES